MERVLTSSQMRSADRYTIDTLGVPEYSLIERAGFAVADEIIKRFRGGRVLVCVGNGNNGNDGKVIAQILGKTHGFSVSIVNVSAGEFDFKERQFDIIVDCIFGTGLNREIDGKYKEIIQKINDYKAYKIACDIPSGLNADTGFAMVVAVKANLTVAIGEYKLGHFLNDGLDYCGEVVAKDIGISIWGDDYAKRLTLSDLKEYFPKRKRNTHKGNYGKVAIVGGSTNYSGSVLLSLNALTALKMGIGYSNLAIPKSIYNGYIGVVPECTFTPIKDKNGNILYDEQSLMSLLKYDCIAIGMGIGVSEEIYKSIKFLLLNYSGILLIDADGLNTIAKYGVEILKEKICKVVLTPHIGEFSRLIKKKSSEIMSNIINISKDFAKDFSVVLVVKNAVSVITDGQEVYLNTCGTSGMAKGGSGDVLSGVIAGIVARCGFSVESVTCGCVIFGKAGEYAEKEQNEYTITAMDIVKKLPAVINAI